MTRSGAESPGSAGGFGPPPRPFGVVDELCTYHDAPAEPNNVHLEVRLSGHLDPRSLRAAVSAVLAGPLQANARRAAHHPMARHFRWEFPAEPDVDPVSLASWVSEADLDREREAFLACAPPLDIAPPFRLLLAAGPGGDCLILNAHHAAFDGLGCLSLLQSIAHSYGGEAAQATHVRSADPGPAPEPDQEAAGGLSRPRRTSPDARQGTGSRTRGPRRLLPQAMSRIAADRGTGERDGYGYHLMPPLEVDALAPARAQYGATVNDLLVCALIIAVARWNSDHGGHAGPIRITVPVATQVAASSPPVDASALRNRSSLAAVTVRWSAGDSDIGELASQVVRQTRLAKSSASPQVDIVSGTLAAAPLPAAAKRLLLRSLLRTIGPLVVDTSLLTNLGALADPMQFGSAATTRLAFSTSAHMPRGLSVGAITIAGHLQVCLRYRHALLDETSAARFATCYTAALRGLAQLAVTT